MNFKSILSSVCKPQQTSLKVAAFALANLSFAQAFAEGGAPVMQPGGAAPGAAAPAGSPPVWINFVLLGGMVLFMYLFIIRPNAKRQKDHKTFLEGLVPGKEVITSSGLIGRITTVADSIVTIDLGNTTVRVLKSAVTSELGQAGSAAAGSLATSSK
jgi:preprotein translocase subunit YajC